MVEAEAIVNTRPLTYLPKASEENEELTSNHFLLGNSCGVRQPAVVITGATKCIRSSWHQVQHQLNMFSKRWIKEYLRMLTKRPKWCGEVKSIAERQLVLVVGEDKRYEWIRGRVVKYYRGGWEDKASYGTNCEGSCAFASG